jgi:hypothetical protein
LEQRKSELGVQTWSAVVEQGQGVEQCLMDMICSKLRGVADDDVLKDLTLSLDGRMSSGLGDLSNQQLRKLYMWMPLMGGV